jgi:hypothetical protein
MVCVLLSKKTEQKASVNKARNCTIEEGKNNLSQLSCNANSITWFIVFTY